MELTIEQKYAMHTLADKKCNVSLILSGRGVVDFRETTVSVVNDLIFLDNGSFNIGMAEAFSMGFGTESICIEFKFEGFYLQIRASL